jgi:outer membrane protein OmpA-like peptidoglycan-associated protein
MQRKIFWMMIALTILLGSTVLTNDSRAQDTEFFIKALTPKNGQSSSDNHSAGTFPKRGLGGVNAISEKPRATMHLHFGLDSDEITPEVAETLQNLGAALEKETLRNFIFRLEGHTCDLGSEAHNMDLSKRRAKAVKQYMTHNFSLSPNQFEVAWYGESRPAVPNKDEASRELNRRVVVENTLRVIDLASQDLPADLQIKRLNGDIEELVKDGDVLGQSDNYALEFRTTSDPYVYIFQVDATGKLDQIFPNSQVSDQQNPVTPNAYYRIPERGKWLYLDENKGSEQLILLSQKAPLSNPKDIATKVNNGGVATGRVRGLGGIHKLQAPAAKEIKSSAEQETEMTESTLFVLKRHFMHQ